MNGDEQDYVPESQSNGTGDVASHDEIGAL